MLAHLHSTPFYVSILKYHTFMLNTDSIVNKRIKVFVYIPENNGSGFLNGSGFVVFAYTLHTTVGDPKMAPVHVPFMLVTHTPNLVEFPGEIFLTPQPPRYPRYPQVPPLWHDPGGQMKIPSDMFYIFHV